MYKEFEELVQKIASEFKSFSANLNDAGIGFGPRNKIEGASGFKHQIDVSLKVPNERLIIVECKRYKSKVALKDMLVLIARVDDIRKNNNVDVRGAFFTTVGYTGPAKKVGKYNNIELNIIDGPKNFVAKIAGNVLANCPPFEGKI